MQVALSEPFINDINFARKPTVVTMVKAPSECLALHYSGSYRSIVEGKSQNTSMEDAPTLTCHTLGFVLRAE